MSRPLRRGEEVGGLLDACAEVSWDGDEVWKVRWKLTPSWDGGSAGVPYFIGQERKTTTMHQQNNKKLHEGSASVDLKFEIPALQKTEPWQREHRIERPALLNPHRHRPQDLNSQSWSATNCTFSLMSVVLFASSFHSCVVSSIPPSTQTPYARGAALLNTRVYAEPKLPPAQDLAAFSLRILITSSTSPISPASTFLPTVQRSSGICLTSSSVPG